MTSLSGGGELPKQNALPSRATNENEVPSTSQVGSLSSLNPSILPTTTATLPVSITSGGSTGNTSIHSSFAYPNVSERVRLLGSQLDLMRSGLAGLQRTLLEGQRVVIAKQVCALQQQQQRQDNKTAEFVGDKISLVQTDGTIATTTSQTNHTQMRSPVKQPIVALLTVHSGLEEESLDPSKRLGLATSVAALLNVCQRLDPDATDSSSGESGSDLSEQDEKPDTAFLMAHKFVDGIASSAVSFKTAKQTGRRYARNQLAWRQQWLKLQLLDLDTRIQGSPHAKFSAFSDTEVTHESGEISAPVSAVLTSTQLTDGSGSLLPLSDSNTCARTRSWQGRKRKLITRRAKAAAVVDAPTPFFHEFLSLPEEQFYVKRRTHQSKRVTTLSQSKQSNDSVNKNETIHIRLPHHTPSGLLPTSSRSSISSPRTPQKQLIASPSVSPIASRRASTTSLSSTVVSSSLRRTLSSPGVASSASNSPAQKKRRASGYDIDNLVIPLSMMQPNIRITPIEYKEILTPSWRDVSKSVVPSLRRSKPSDGLLEEPTDDDAYNRRHQPKEMLEKAGKRFDVLAQERRRLMLLAEEQTDPWHSLMNPSTSVIVTLGSVDTDIDQLVQSGL